MADLLIKNISLPPSGKQLCFCVMHNGTVWQEEARDMMPTEMKAIELPSHGGLKDYDALGSKMTRRYERNKEKWELSFIDGFMYALKMLDKAPTVIPASEGKQNK